MLQVKQFRYAADNLGYLVYGRSCALATDGGASEKILSFLKTMGLNLFFVANTHAHPDHTTGNTALTGKTKARLLTYGDLPDNGDIDIFLENYDPGHVHSTLQDEMKVNPYLRFNDEKMIAVLRKKGLPCDTEWERWQSLMGLE